MHLKVIQCGIFRWNNNCFTYTPVCLQHFRTFVVQDIHKNCYLCKINVQHKLLHNHPESYHNKLFQTTKKQSPFFDKIFVLLHILIMNSHCTHITLNSNQLFRKTPLPTFCQDLLSKCSSTSIL